MCVRLCVTTMRKTKSKCILKESQRNLLGACNHPKESPFLKITVADDSSQE